MLLLVAAFGTAQTADFSEDTRAEATPTAEKFGTTVDIDLTRNGQQLPYSGYYYGELDVDGTTRVWKEYFPSDYEMQTYQVMLNVPDGANTEDFILNSGWKALADEHNFALFILEPDTNGWGAPTDEQAYVTAAYGKRITATKTHSTYVVGYGNGGTALHMHIMTTAITVASAAFVDASEISDAYLADLDNHTFPKRVDPYADSTIKYSEAPVPVWIIEDNLNDASNVIAHWKKANHSMAEGDEFYGGTIYSQDGDIVVAGATMTTGDVAKVAVLEDRADVMQPALAKMLYEDFLSLTTRYGGVATCNTIGSRPDYQELGVEFGGFEDQGYWRDYLVYVPGDFRDSEAALPLVFMAHGANQSYESLFDCTRWWEVADEEGIILVFVNGTLGSDTAATGTAPSTTWVGNRADTRVNDAEYMKVLHDKVLAEYNVDATRVYIHGQSNGGTLVSASANTYPELFAAVGSTTGLGMTPTKENPPFSFYLAGEFDGSNNENYATNQGLISQLDALGVDTTASDLNVGSILPVDSRHRLYTWYREDGFTPLHQATVVKDRGHSLMPANIRYLWKLGFSKWSRDDETGELVYSAF